ncbi:MAG: sterol desaturase/sphingolipid hydroxylase (fatty acid hydroxylase superfamily) [Alphaproteobacteria bacterium]|jgi:sterol desaturase/sphingolipid hydroxylase (fatty acid hydroxylase superfamily)
MLTTLKKFKESTVSMKRDVISSLIYITGFKHLIGYTLLLGLPFLMGGFISETHNFQFIKLIESEISNTVVSIIIMSFFEYWFHRSFHKIKPLWKLHKFHHSNTEIKSFAQEDSCIINQIFGTNGGGLLHVL